MIVAAEGSTKEINRDEVSVIFDGENMIVNVGSLGVSKTVGGGAASAFVEAKLVDANVGPVSHGSTAFANGKVVVASEDGEEVSVNLDRENFTVNIKSVHVDTPSAAVVEGEVASEDIVPESVQVFAESIGVSCDATTALVKGQTSAVVESKLIDVNAAPVSVI